MPQHIGVMVTPRSSTRAPDHRVFAIDTGCFANPDKYSDDRYLAFLDRQAHARERCLFATAPDRVGDAATTLAIALPVLPLIREQGFAAALVAQDGMERMTLPWERFDWLFIGGTTGWKLSVEAGEIAREAIARGKRVHMGRVNSYKRLAYARAIGCDSADGTFLSFAPDKNIPRLQRWFDRLHNTPLQQTLC